MTLTGWLHGERMGRWRGAANGGGRVRRGHPGEQVHGCVSQLRRCTHMDQGHSERSLGRSGCGEKQIKQCGSPESTCSGEERRDKMEE